MVGLVPGETRGLGERSERKPGHHQDTNPERELKASPKHALRHEDQHQETSTGWHFRSARSHLLRLGLLDQNAVSHQHTMDIAGGLGQT